jgi:diguanylate cyclase (GGDEF)-like protein
MQSGWMNPTRGAMAMLNFEDFMPEPGPRHEAVVAGIDAGDWDEMLRAVLDRLGQAVGDTLVEARAADSRQAAGRVRASVLECVVALRSLHTTLGHEAGRCRRLEREIFNLRSSLEMARAEAVEAQMSERRLRRQALLDGLTWLPNRSFFLDRLDGAVANARPERQAIAVLYVDLDGFRPINHQHGHEVGDAVLRGVATRLTRSVHADDMVSRIGGDEFACLLVERPSRERLSHLAGKIIDAVSAPLQIGTLALVVRPSIGIAVWPEDGTTAKTLFKTADAAMSRAKRQRTGFAFCDERAEAWAQETAQFAMGEAGVVAASPESASG